MTQQNEEQAHGLYTVGGGGGGGVCVCVCVKRG